MWFCDHQVGIDVLDSQREFGFGGVWAEHRDDAAPKADRNARGDGVPRVVGLDEGGRRGRMDGRDPVGQRAGRLDDLANGVRTEFVHDRNLIRRAPGPLDHFLCKCFHRPDSLVTLAIFTRSCVFGWVRAGRGRSGESTVAERVPPVP